MHTHTHGLISWVVANFPDFDRKDRALVTIAGLAPDIDGLTIVAGGDAFRQYHHVLCHNIFFALILTGVSIALAKRKLLTGGLCFAVFHLHLLCDLIGGAAPGGDIWPMAYFWPASDWSFYSPYMWELASWQNVVATIIVVIWSLWIAARKGRSPVEIVSPKLDTKIVETIQRRWPKTKE